MDRQHLKFAVFGGDARHEFLYRALQEEGYHVRSYALPGEPNTADWETILKDTDCLLLPLPLTRDGVRLFTDAENDDAGIRLDLLAKAGVPYLFGGKLPESFRSQVAAAGSIVFDYFDSEWLQVKNALATAEGALFVAMQELPITLDGTCVVVTGYGRIGRILTEKLVLLGAQVTVYERREDLHAWISLAHAEPKFFGASGKASLLPGMPPSCRLIFNTVPERIFREEALDAIPERCLFVDLASPPGGIDLAAAKEKGLFTLWATALPGKYAPESAAKYLFEVVKQRLDSLLPDG